MEAEDIGYGESASNYCQVTLVKVVERRWLWLFLHTRANHFGCVRSALHGDLCHAGQRLAVPSGGKRQVAHHKDVRIVWYRQLRSHRNAAETIGLRPDALRQFSAESITGNPAGPKNGFCPQ